MYTFVKRAQAPVSGDVDLASHGQQVLEVAAYLRLHVDLHHVHRVEHRAGETADQSTANEIRQQRVVPAHQLLRLIPQREEHQIGQTVSVYDGNHAAITLAYPVMLQQVPEGVRSILKLAVVSPVLQQRLHPFEGHQESLRHARQIRCHQPGQHVVPGQHAESLSASLVHAEHQTQGQGLLAQRWQDPTVKQSYSFA